MKKPIGKRVIGFLSAAALAVTSMTSSLIKPLTAAAAFAYRNVLVTVYDVDGSQVALKGQDGNRYYVLGMLSEKGVEPKKNDDGTWENVKGWGLQEFHPETLDYDKQIGQDPEDHYDVTSTDLIECNRYGQFFAYGEDGSTKTTILPYNSDYYDFTARIYRTIGWNITLDTLADCVDPEKAADTILGYKFGSDNGNFTNWNKGDTTKIAITKYTATYDVELKADEATTFTEDDNLWLRVEVNHGSNNNSYYVKKLTAADFAAGKISIQTDTTSNWLDNNGTVKANERVSGDEKGFSTTLVKATGTPS
ncbi:MAG: hypothetical protein IJ555_07120, partial [Ruminococcus sp.]|nr:hypothetical protein [Ruminococcus sp.]